MEFDSVIAPLTRETFLGDYWTKSFVRMPGMAGRFTALLTWDELNGILEQHRLAPPRLKLFQNGQAIAPERWLTPAMFGVPRPDSGRMAAALAEGASLILDDVQDLAPRVLALTQSFQEVLHTDTYVNLYASWHSQNGFDLHWDAQDSVMIQLSGRKHWKVYPPTRFHPLQNDLEPPPRPAGEPVWDGMMEDGDAIHVPRGWWHVAFPVNAPSLHLTVAATPPHGMDFLGWAVAALRRHAELRAALPSANDPAAQTAYLKSLRRRLDEAMGDGAIAAFLREWEANIRPAPHIRLPGSPYEQQAMPTAGSRIRLAALHRLFLVAEAGNFTFKAAGVLWTVPMELVPALEKLSNTRDLTLAQLSAELSAPDAIAKLEKSIGVLARAGVVLIEKP